MSKVLNKIKKIIPVGIFKALQPIYHFVLSSLAAVSFRFPSENLIVIGVTGTTGKTTTVFLIAKMLASAGYKVGYTSTAMFSDGNKEWLNDKKMTMVGRFFTQNILRDMVKNGCQYAIVETTSEGVRQFRHRFINYDILVFTGLYPEHIESHGGFENYKKAKGQLFAHLKKCGAKYADDGKNIKRNLSGLKKTELNKIKKTIVANLDDEHVDYFLDFWAEEKIGYTQTRKQENASTSSTRARNNFIEYGGITSSEKGIGFEVLDTKIQLQLLGEFNAVNSMAAVCVGLSQNISLAEIRSGLEKIKGVPGRLENINEGQDFTVMVDYAFEPNAVAKLYETVEDMPHNKIIHVLGSCGGGRDVSRRSVLGRIAGERADIVVVTNEDPYDDDPRMIIDQVAEGALAQGKKEGENLFKIVDREEAIKKAISLAEEGDVVLVTGKGSEQAICVADGEKIAWDDREVARKALKSKN